MKTNWRTFLTRAVSALIAIGILVTLFLNFQEKGIKYAITAVVFLGIYELNRLLLKKQSLLLQSTFCLLTLLVFGSTISSLSTGSLIISVAFVIFCIVSFLNLHKTEELDQILLIQAKAVMGMVYMGLLPAFSYRILDQAYGLNWFVYLLAIVFAGDTCAYIFGMLFGRHKMMPRVSPKKTWQGSFGGVVGSAIAAIVCHQLLLHHVSIWALVGISILAGLCGQYGDFFESLLKRLANVKDSGKIMPGHGGALDRVDAVLFASPVVLTAILIMTHLSN